MDKTPSLDAIFNELLKLSSDLNRYDAIDMVYDAAEQTIGRLLTLQEKDRIKFLLEQINTTHHYSDEILRDAK